MKNLLLTKRHLSSFKNCLNNVLFLPNYTLKQYFQSTTSRSQHRTVSPTLTGWPSIRNQRLRVLYKCFRVWNCIETFKQIIKVRFIKSIKEFYRIPFIFEFDEAIDVEILPYTVYQRIRSHLAFWLSTYNSLQWIDLSKVSLLISKLVNTIKSDLKFAFFILEYFP